MKSLDYESELFCSDSGRVGSCWSVQAGLIDTTPGLVYHLDAGLGVSTGAGGLVSTWADQSGNGNTFVGGHEAPTERDGPNAGVQWS